MHHIFFPPRLEVVAVQQDANGLPSDPRYQLSLDGFFGDQPHIPTGLAARGIRAHHRDDSLFVGRAE
jgi:hypothetical protein